jgi:hypothetical protein
LSIIQPQPVIIFPVYSLFNTYSLIAKEIENNQVESFSFIPNPSSDQIVFHEDFNLEDVIILNSLGQNMQGKFDVFDDVIHIQNLPVGIYWILSKNNINSLKNKLIIVR